VQVKNAVVYWLYDENCSDPRIHGYIGVTYYIKRRMREHQLNEKFPTFEFTILFKGSREECFEYEKLLRPEKGIGWNNAVGGAQGWKQGYVLSKGKKKGPFSTEHRKSLSEARKRFFVNGGTSWNAGTKKPKPKKPRLPHSEETKRKIGEANRQKKKSEELKQQISKNMQLKWQDPEYRANQKVWRSS
jgi:hypothetical protein